MPAETATTNDAQKTVMTVLLAISFSHLLNDTIQSLIPSLYPVFKTSLHLNFTQIGLITLTFQLTASLLQPLVGYYTDLKPHPYALSSGMCFSLLGVVLLASANSFSMILVAVGFVGIGSSVFHPEASRVAHMAAGMRHGFAQALFQVGGSAGTSLGPLLAALILGPEGDSKRILWFSVAAVAAIILLWNIGHWYKQNMARLRLKKDRAGIGEAAAAPRAKVALSMTVLVALMFSKFFYLAGVSSYYTFYLIDTFHVSIPAAQVRLFIFLFSAAIGTLAGGPIGDRFGRKHVIWISILGAAPFTLLLPHVGLFWTGVLSVVIGLILSSAFPAILVYGQEMMPGKVGLISGLFFGLAFGLGGIGSAVLGNLADHTSIHFVFLVCSFLPLIGLLTAFLPAEPARS
jgi:FSR family fosmidomycin resistance protein-like MFS transporter